jgi:hypothetical protein
MGALTVCDACPCIDQKLRRLAKALKSWRASCVGDVRLQLAASRAMIYDRARHGSGVQRAICMRANGPGCKSLRPRYSVYPLWHARWEDNMQEQGSYVKEMRAQNTSTF